MIDLTAFQQLALLSIAISERQDGDTPHGLAIKDHLEEMYGDEVNHGRLYPNLDTLVDSGLITKTERDKRTNEYSLTEDGSRAISNLRMLTHLAEGKDGANPYIGSEPAVSSNADQAADAD